MEALEGRSEVMSGGLLSPEREELSSRMRFKRRKLDEKELPPPPDLPPLEQIKERLVSIIDRICPLKPDWAVEAGLAAGSERLYHEKYFISPSSYCWA